MTKSELYALRRLRKAITFENASFGFQHDKVDGVQVTEFIKERTRLYQETWVLPILDDMIAKHAHKLEDTPKPSGWSSVTEDYSYFN